MTHPIRVLQVVTHMNRGGLETMLMNYYRHMDREKVQFDFLVHRTERADYDDEIEELGGKIYRLPRLIPWSRTYKNALNAFFKNHPEYRIVHVHQDCLSSVILGAAKKNGVPVRIAHSHNSAQDKNIKYLVKLYYKRFIPRFATDLFACAKDAGDWMFGGASYQLLNNAIDSAAYYFDESHRKAVREALAIPEDSLVLGHVGRFSPQKNHTYLIDIFSAIHAKRQDSFLLLVGDGNLRLGMEDKIRHLGLEDYVIFTGLRSDVPDLLQAMDVFIFPSLYEGLPVTLVEAQASGLPCVISDRIPSDCDLTELITRVSLDEGPEFWTEQILSLKDYPRRNTHAEIIAAGFDISENAKCLEKFYLQRWSVG